MVKTVKRTRLRAGFDDVPWYKRPLSKEDFITISNGKEFYARHQVWKKTILIGPYEAQEALNKVIEQYIREANKTYLKRKEIRNFKTCVTVLDDSFKEI